MPKRTNIQILLFAGLLTLVAGPSWARTWLVAKGNVGDFRAIQSAVNAATSGDTIRIGPGRFYDMTIESSTSRAWHVRNTDKNLTYIGSDEGETIVGYEELVYPSYTIFGFRQGPDVQYCEYRNLVFENIRLTGIAAGSGGFLVEGCVFRNSYSGMVVCGTTESHIRSCYFENVGQGIVYDSPVVDAYIDDCVFINCNNGVGCYWPCESITVSNCTISGGLTGVAFVDGASGVVSNCTISGQDLWGICANKAGTVIVEDSHITMDHENNRGFAFGFYQRPGTITLRRNVFSAGRENAVFFVRPPGFEIAMENNHFIRLGENAFFIHGYISNGYTGPAVHMDFSGNWWGTTDTDLIDQWIVDLSNEGRPDIIIDYEPILDGPVPTEKTSMGGLKALYR